MFDEFVYFVVKEGMAFRKYLKICALQQKNSLDLGQNYLSDIACGRLVSSIAEDTKSDLKLDVKIDAGILEEEIVYIWYLKENAL